jgi:D-alanine transaminase
MLPGITYDVVLEIAAANHIPHAVRRITVAEVFSADELLLTSSTKEVLAITHLNGEPVGTGKPGPMFARLHRLYQDFKRDVMRANPRSAAADQERRNDDE